MTLTLPLRLDPTSPPDDTLHVTASGLPVRIYAEATGRDYTTNPTLFSHRFAAVREQAAASMPSLADVQFRDLRRTFGHRARAGGATKDDAADVLGNSAATDPQLQEIYMAPQFWTASRAVLAGRRPDHDRQKEQKA